MPKAAPAEIQKVLCECGFQLPAVRGKYPHNCPNCDKALNPKATKDGTRGRPDPDTRRR